MKYEEFMKLSIEDRANHNLEVIKDVELKENGIFGNLEFWDKFSGWINTLYFNSIGTILYRLAPTEEYRPFTFDDDLLGLKIKSKNGSKLKAIIIGQGYEFVDTTYETISYKELFEEYTFLDGSPCGVKN